MLVIITLIESFPKYRIRVIRRHKPKADSQALKVRIIIKRNVLSWLTKPKDQTVTTTNQRIAVSRVRIAINKCLRCIEKVARIIIVKVIKRIDNIIAERVSAHFLIYKTSASILAFSASTHKKNFNFRYPKPMFWINYEMGYLMEDPYF